MILKWLLSRFLDRLIETDLNVKQMEKWLYRCYEDKGFKTYYTLRRKSIKDYLSLGVKQKDYWRAIGRLDELTALSRNIKEEFARQQAKNNANKKGTKQESDQGKHFRTYAVANVTKPEKGNDDTSKKAAHESSKGKENAISSNSNE